MKASSPGWFEKYVGTYGQREIARGLRVLRLVNGIGAVLKEETDQQLHIRAQRLREAAKSGVSLTDLMAETFAVVREVSSRQTGMRHFDVQILGGVALHRGNIVEMKTGEGKTLAATLPVVLNALSGKGAHVITVNDYLAWRDAQWMRPIYDFMGLSVGVVLDDMDDGEDKRSRKAAYQADITYVTNHELVFDYLRDNLARSRDEQVHQPLNFALIDEVDLLLLDEAGTPLIISGAASESSNLFMKARHIVSSLQEGADFRVDHKTRRVSIHDEGWTRMERAVGVENLAAPELLDWQHALHSALLAHAVYQQDVDYIVQDGEILLVDDYTGRVSPDKRYSDGLHQALEAKEGVTIQAEDRTLAKISYQMFFRLYPSLCGMTGTAYSAREEIHRTYGLRVVVIPTNKPVIRIDRPASVFRSSAEKFEAVMDEIHELVKRGRPVLVGTTSVKESEQVSRLLSERGIEHTVLNAKDDSSEAAIIAQAGRLSAVTVSTNMAGRGVDILLGGNPDGLMGEDREAVRKQCEADRARIVSKGGLMVIGTGLHESRRIDDQLRGRSGRQGDPGGSHYFLSLDDPIYRKFGERDRGFQVIHDLHHRLRDHPHGEPVTNRSILRTLLELQKKVEVENESIRREVLRYDVVVEQQRRTIYGWRQTILAQQPSDTLALLQKMAGDLSAELMKQPASNEDDPPGGTRQDIAATVLDALNVEAVDPGVTPSEVVAAILARFEERLSEIERTMGAGRLAAVVGQVMLSTIDEMWTEHLNNLEHLDDSVGLRGYAQLDPLLEFKREAHNLCQAMLIEIRITTLARLLDLLTIETTKPDTCV